jgi:hypothetical protein
MLWHVLLDTFAMIGAILFFGIMFVIMFFLFAQLVRDDE